MSLTSIFSNLNFAAVLVVGIVHMVIGLIWFMPGVFGRQWMELTKQEMKPARQWIAAGVVGHQVIALVLSVVVYLANATTMLEGACVGMLMWMGFVVTLEVGELIWEKIPFKLFAIRIGNHFVGFSVSGLILAVWR
jgi:hypothetical protein